jgi:3-deoxy-D-manno-octulosonic acid (KDO) 8-phosphate synthase
MDMFKPKVPAWRKRLLNFGKSLSLLEMAMDIRGADIAVKAGIVHFFDATYDLALNTLKDYFRSLGVDEIIADDLVLKKAAEVGLIEDAEAWKQLSNSHNLHLLAGDPAMVLKTTDLIEQKYYALLKDLYNGFKSKQD